MATKKQAKDFLTKIASDAAFRAAVEKDPVKHMSKFGFKINKKFVPAEGIKLPSNDAIKKNIDHLSERAESTAGEIFFCL
jgi:hypothetical protein